MPKKSRRNKAPDLVTHLHKLEDDTLRDDQLSAVSELKSDSSAISSYASLEDILYRTSEQPDNLPAYSAEDIEFMQLLGRHNLLRAHVFPIEATKNLIKKVIEETDIALIPKDIKSALKKERDAVGSLADKVPYLVVPKEIEENINSIIRLYAIEQSECADDERFSSVKVSREEYKLNREVKRHAENSNFTRQIAEKTTRIDFLTEEIQSPNKKRSKFSKSQQDEDQAKEDEIKNLEKEIGNLTGRIEKNNKANEPQPTKYSAILNETEFAEQHPDVYLQIFEFILKSSAQETSNPELITRLEVNLSNAIKDFQSFSQNIKTQANLVDSEGLFNVSPETMSRAKTPTPNSTPRSTPNFIPRNSSDNLSRLSSPSPDTSRKTPTKKGGTRKGKFKLSKNPLPDVPDTRNPLPDVPDKPDLIQGYTTSPSSSDSSTPIKERSSMMLHDVTITSGQPPSLEGLKDFIRNYEDTKSNLMWLKTQINEIESSTTTEDLKASSKAQTPEATKLQATTKETHL